jgi:hypothetical protein
MTMRIGPSTFARAGFLMSGEAQWVSEIRKANADAAERRERCFMGGFSDLLFTCSVKYSTSLPLSLLIFSIAWQQVSTILPCIQATGASSEDFVKSIMPQKPASLLFFELAYSMFHVSYAGAAGLFSFDALSGTA